MASAGAVVGVGEAVVGYGGWGVVDDCAAT